VISVHNDSDRHVYPAMEDDAPYVANGDIGIAVGQWMVKRMKRAPWKLEVQFASQPGYAYDYSRRDFGEEASAPLELAYALTVHKTQGSEFRRTFVVIPDPMPQSHARAALHGAHAPASARHHPLPGRSRRSQALRRAR
jgi:ATP-dependent exoDNAse (exonuclease V) alpha subunit